jgi:hypothetical protein
VPERRLSVYSLLIATASDAGNPKPRALRAIRQLPVCSGQSAGGTAKVLSQALENGLAQRLEVVLLQEPERGLERLLLVGLLQGLE